MNEQVKKDIEEWVKAHPQVKKTPEDRVKAILAAQFSVDVSQVDLNADLKDAFDADSLDVVELSMGVEDEFGVDIPDDVMPRFKTGADIVEYVRFGTVRGK